MYGLFRIPADQLAALAQEAYDRGARAVAYRVLLEADRRKRAA